MFIFSFIVFDFAFMVCFKQRKTVQGENQDV